MLGGAVRRVWIAALVGAVLVALGACGGDDDEESTGTTAASTTSAPSTTLANPSSEVEEAYLAYWDAYLKASSEPVKPDIPELQALMTGDHQRAVTRNLRNLQGSGRAVRERENSRYRNVFGRVEFAGEAEASFSACSYDDLVTYDVATGVPVDDSVATKWLEGQMVREGAAWKVARLKIVSRETGRDQCPL